MIVYELEIPQLYTAVGKQLHRNGYACPIQYLCCKCRQLFAANWEKVGMNWRGHHFDCPHCGETHYESLYTAIHDKQIPLSARFVVEVFKRVVNLRVTYQTIMFRSLFNVYEAPYREIFRFDLAQNKVLHSSNACAKDATKEIGNPFDECLSVRSFLPFIEQRSLAKKQRNQIAEMLKVLREAIERRQSGSKKKSMWVPYGTELGYMLAPIENMAYRVTYPDADNLPKEYRSGINTRNCFARRNFLQNTGSVLWQNAKEVMRAKKVDFRTAMIEATKLPNKKSVREAIGKNQFSVNILKEALRLCENFDLAMQLYKGLEENHQWHDLGYSTNDDIGWRNLNFMEKLKEWYGETGLVHAVKNFSKLQINDCRSLYGQLNEEHRQAFLKAKVSLIDLHDWLMREHRRQKHPNIKFDIPDHVVRRLAMQVDSMKFFLPDESDALFEIGNKLNNCVASYSDRVKSGKAGIIAMTDDRGLLVACIQTHNNKVVQAKLKHNKPVWGNAAINNAIVEWAAKAQLEIKTADIRVAKKEEKKERVS